MKHILIFIEKIGILIVLIMSFVLVPLVLIFEELQNLYYYLRYEFFTKGHFFMYIRLYKLIYRGLTKWQ